MENNPGKLISILHRKGQIYWGHQLKDIGVSTAEYPILIMLQNHDGISQEQIASNLGIDKSGVTRVIQSLEKRNLIMRKKGKEDKRCNLIFLTDEGEATREVINKSRFGWNDYLMDGMSDAEKIEFCRLLKKSVDHMTSFEKSKF